ncbi:MAG: MFS transporter [Anaerotignum sp.]|nr:MFS transporter [Anaerotignum sp.]
MTKQKKLTLLAIAIVLVSCNLRAPFTGVGSMVGLIQEDLGLSGSGAGMLTTIPLLAFAAVSPFVGTLCKKFGAGHVLLMSLLVLIAGIIIRNFGGGMGLYIGTAVVGIGIAVGNVLPPAIIKVYFPEKLGLMTGLYSTFLSVGASIASGISIPIAVAFGWKAALSVWLLLSVPTFLICLPNKDIQIADEGSSSGSSSHIYRSPLTWWITLYMGVQSLVFYGFAAWMASIIQAKGFDSATAGLFVSAFMMLGIPTSFIVPIFAGKMKNQSALGALIGFGYTLGATILFLADSIPMLILAIVCCAFSSGGSISFIMAAFGLRTKNGEDASNLSGTAQCLGYLLAAIGPVFFGKIFDSTQSWIIPMLILIGCNAFLLVAGWVIGKDRVIE